MSLDDRAEGIHVLGIQIQEKEFLEMAKFLDKFQSDPLKAFLFVNSYVGWVVAQYQDMRLLPPELIMKLPKMAAKVAHTIYLETRSRHEKRESQSP